MAKSKFTDIHPAAIIPDSCEISNFVTISEDVQMGENCWVGANAVIMDGARIGNNVKIFPGAVISAEPQDLKYKGERTLTSIGDNTTIREYCTINKGTIAAGETKIGQECLIMAYSHVAHDCIIGDHVILANNVNLAGHIEIKDWSIISGMAAVAQFVTIGPHVLIGGYSQVRTNVPPYVKAARDPLAFAGVNSIGLKRRGFTDERINLIQDI